MRDDATQVYLYAIARTKNGSVNMERFIIAHPHHAPETDPTGETHLLRLSAQQGPSAALAVDKMREKIAMLAPHSRFWQFVDANVTFPSVAPAAPKPAKRPFVSRTRIVVRQRRAG